jgi:hypothetical protein
LNKWYEFAAKMLQDISIRKQKDSEAKNKNLISKMKEETNILKQDISNQENTFNKFKYDNEININKLNNQNIHLEDEIKRIKTENENNKIELNNSILELKKLKSNEINKLLDEINDKEVNSDKKDNVIFNLKSNHSKEMAVMNEKIRNNIDQIESLKNKNKK